MEQATESGTVEQMADGRVGLVVLAAGGARRMGAPKQLLRYEGRSLLRRTVEAALDSVCRPVIVVVGARAAEVRFELNGLEVRVAENTAWEQGLSTSIRAGVTALVEAHPGHSAVIVSVGDQPHLSARVLDELVAVHRSTKKPIVASRYGGTLGPPALFAREFFEALCALEGDAGAKQVLRRYAAQTAAVDFEAGSVDIDTLADYEKLRRAGEELAAQVDDLSGG